MFQKIKTRWKRICTTDNIIDLSVHILLIVYDVLSSPILIVVRLLRYVFKKAFSKRLKQFLKWFVHKVLRIQ